MERTFLDFAIFSGLLSRVKTRRLRAILVFLFMNRENVREFPGVASADFDHASLPARFFGGKDRQVTLQCLVRPGENV